MPFLIIALKLHLKTVSLTILSFYSDFLLDLTLLLVQLRGPQETCQTKRQKTKESVRKTSGKREAVIEKQKSKWRPDSAGAPKKKKK